MGEGGAVEEEAEVLRPEEMHAEGLHQLDMGADLDGEVGGYIPTFIEQADRLDHPEADSSDSEDELRDAEVDAHMLATGKVRHLCTPVRERRTPLSASSRFLRACRLWSCPSPENPKRQRGPVESPGQRPPLHSGVAYVWHRPVP
jgi:hypothetical protein